MNRRIPVVVPADWRINPAGGMETIYRFYGPMQAHYSEELLEATEAFREGWYRHASFSRQDRYPGWDEMRKALKEIPWIDNEREVIMTIPPPGEYVNLHQNCFRWNQWIGPA